MTICVACEWHLKPNNEVSDEDVVVERYDRMQTHYLTTGDFAALQQMNTKYPMQTRTLIEDVLKIGQVNDPEINAKYLHFYQDTTLQQIITEAEIQYSNMDDIEKEFTKAFKKLLTLLPDIKVPMVYAQIGSLDQSVIVGNQSIGFCLDKYLGKDYPLYRKFYPEQQRKMMVREMIVPDCILFYLLSYYPIPSSRNMTQTECDIHMGKMQWMVNQVVGKRAFANKYVARAERQAKTEKPKDLNTFLLP